MRDFFRTRAARMAVVAGFTLLPCVARAEDPAAGKPADATAPAPVVERLDVKPGDRWTYQSVDDVSGETKGSITFTLTEIRDRTFSVQFAFTPNGQNFTNTSLHVFDDAWNLLDDQTWTRAPGDPATGVRLPLKLGDVWRRDYVANRKTPNVTINVSSASSVAAYEPVMLRFNRSYDAYRIETLQAWVGGPNGAANTTKITMWYAPAVNRYVKRILETRVNDRLQSRTIETLTNYARRREE